MGGNYVHRNRLRGGRHPADPAADVDLLNVEACHRINFKDQVTRSLVMEPWRRRPSTGTRIRKLKNVKPEERWCNAA